MTTIATTTTHDRHTTERRLKVVRTFVQRGKSWRFITARKRSLRRLCFYRCLSVHRGGVRGCSRGVCIVAPGGGMHGCSRRACMVAPGGRALLLRGGLHGSPGGACVVARGGRAWFFRWDTVNERAVRILLECILVYIKVQEDFPHDDFNMRRIVSRIHG